MHLEIDSAQDRPVGLVAEDDALEAHVAYAVAVHVQVMSIGQTPLVV